MKAIKLKESVVFIRYVRLFMMGPLRVATLAFLMGVLVMPSFSSSAEELAAPTAATAEKDHQSQPIYDLQRRGKQLREAIEQRYKELAESHQIGFKTPFDDVIEKCITASMSFEDVKLIFQAAGINYRIIDEHVKRPLLLAWLVMPSSSWPISISHTEIEISIFPKREGDFHSGVGEIEANILSKDL